MSVNKTKEKYSFMLKFNEPIEVIVTPCINKLLLGGFVIGSEPSHARMSPLPFASPFCFLVTSILEAAAALLLLPVDGIVLGSRMLTSTRLQVLLDYR